MAHNRQETKFCSRVWDWTGGQNPCGRKTLSPDTESSCTWL